jgi:hypothetical protein
VRGLTPREVDARIRGLHRDRHVVLDAMRMGDGTPGQHRLLRHLEREIDWHEAKEMRPHWEARRREVREVRALARRVTRLVTLLDDPRERGEGPDATASQPSRRER